MQNLIWVSSIMPNLEETNDTVPRKHLDRWKDKQPLFHRALQANVGGPKNINKKNHISK